MVLLPIFFGSHRFRLHQAGSFTPPPDCSSCLPWTGWIQGPVTRYKHLRVALVASWPRGVANQGSGSAAE
jgi:hypothetical protein